VVCTEPDPTGAEKAEFRTYASLKDLYDAYQAEAARLGGHPLQANGADCSLRSQDGEVSWNHHFQHPTGYSLAQLQEGKLDPESQAAGRVFCVLDATTQTFLWTQNDGMILGEVTGGPHVSTWRWWRQVHHDIAEVGMGMGMSATP
jgi:hypothetical protein